MAGEVTKLIIITTLIFLMAPAFLIMYMFVNNTRKKRYIEEKVQMQLSFEAEVAKTQLEVQEQTLQTIGADLHDNIGQLLSLTSLTLNSIEVTDDVKTRKKVDAAIDLTLKSIKELRHLGKLLQGDQLIAIGLAQAVQHEVEWLERSGKYKISYEHKNNLPHGNTDKDLIIFRILQEALNNIIKHSGASRINIQLTYRDATLYLHINDNGVGFNTDSTTNGMHGMGLLNINKRAAIVGGEVSIRSKPGEGTGITIIIPYT